ncbi:hypothetical protein B296_00019438 [Ensete ventricosum]|uniref:Transmembrane protein n=1 Tax=Ensete ventricosum TaxID=4639 RepID=A0A426ZD76_ENSVE|nr:hypothetical protein B296_00019438 [Ensete ventricosum]
MERMLGRAPQQLSGRLRLGKIPPSLTRKAQLSRVDMIEPEERKAYSGFSDRPFTHSLSRLLYHEIRVPASMLFGLSHRPRDLSGNVKKKTYEEIQTLVLFLLVLLVVIVILPTILFAAKNADPGSRVRDHRYLLLRRCERSGREKRWKESDGSSRGAEEAMKGEMEKDAMEAREKQRPNGCGRSSLGRCGTHVHAFLTCRALQETSLWFADQRRTARTNDSTEARTMASLAQSFLGSLKHLSHCEHSDRELQPEKWQQ